MKTITSRHNPEIQSIAKLISDNKERQRQGRFVAEGVRACSTLLKSKTITLVRLYVREDMLDTALTFAEQSQMHLVVDTVMEKISSSSSQSGIVGVFTIPSNPKPELLQKGLVLAHITDPGNMGTLIRSCVAFNIQTVVVVEGCDPWNPKVVQATAGMIGNINLFRLSWSELMTLKKERKLCALVVSGGKVPTSDYKEALLVVGNEAHGIKKEWLAECEETITIPMPGNAESLNAAVAGSLALYLTQ